MLCAKKCWYSTTVRLYNLKKAWYRYTLNINHILLYENNSLRIDIEPLIRTRQKKYILESRSYFF